MLRRETNDFALKLELNLEALQICPTKIHIAVANASIYEDIYARQSLPHSFMSWQLVSSVSRASQVDLGPWPWAGHRWPKDLIICPTPSFSADEKPLHAAQPLQISKTERDVAWSGTGNRHCVVAKAYCIFAKYGAEACFFLTEHRMKLYNRHRLLFVLRSPSTLVASA